MVKQKPGMQPKKAEPEVSRQELIDALQEVLVQLSDSLKGPYRREFQITGLTLTENDWFFTAMPDALGQFSAGMWPAEGEVDAVYIDIGKEKDVHRLASNRGMVAALADRFAAEGFQPAPAAGQPRPSPSAIASKPPPPAASKPKPAPPARATEPPRAPHGAPEPESPRDEMIAALQELLTRLSAGLKGSRRRQFLVPGAPLVENDWFFLAIPDDDGQFAAGLWPAEGEQETIYLDIGGEEDVRKLAATPRRIAAMVDQFIKETEG